MKTKKLFFKEKNHWKKIPEGQVVGVGAGEEGTHVVS